MLIQIEAHHLYSPELELSIDKERQRKVASMSTILSC